ncbi:putative amidase AmiB2 [Longispora fulva]|uniref:Amidase n=1 Tax=Longispora fulva TaxID=619741 RepID=A0A8J7GIW7_9ACTN|nr:amidase [Longispora fulva]MBG6138926.1 amidase [Longispora fulva]GIG58418.1 putative amidase AmiB2 [Longispora fulva]
MAWVGATAREIARAVRRGDASATEVVADHLDYIRSTDRHLGAFRALRGPRALAEAEAVDGLPELTNLPLAGVPVAVKENVAVAGERSGADWPHVADADHEVVRRLRGAGAIVVGTSRMPELGLWGTCDDKEIVTRNPWRLDRSPGGSSGGSAAAVSAGLVPIAHGNDGLGSIRIPAACCGLVGLKPGRGVVPAGIGANAWYGLAENGILATTVADAAVGFAVLAGRRTHKLTEPGRLRVAVSLHSPIPGVSPDADNRAAVSRAVRSLVGAGHSAIRAEVPYPKRLGAVVLATWTASSYLDSRDLDYSELQRRTRRHVALGEQAVRTAEVTSGQRTRWRGQALSWLGDYDLLVTPALAGAPLEAAEWSRRPWRANLVANMRYAPYSAPWNVAGLPAIVVPSGVRGDGLPAAVQLVGPPGSELMLLAVAGLLELAAPWRRHAPSWPRAPRSRS